MVTVDMANALSKVVFSLEMEENLKPLAQSLFMGVINPDEIRRELYSRKVLDYVEEERTIRSTSESRSDGLGEFSGTTDTESTGGPIDDGARQDARLWNQSSAISDGTSRTRMSGGTKGESTVPFLSPVFGEELSSVQYRSIEEQYHRAMATLFDQEQRHGVARLVGMRAPVNVVTPTVERQPTSKAMADSFLTRAYAKLPFVLRSAEAHKQIEDRKQQIIEGAQRADSDEPIAVRRRIA